MVAPEPKFPFARELREQHDALWAVVRWLRAEVEPGRPDGPGERVDGVVLLRVFREQLAQHFGFEERNGSEGDFGSHDPEIQRWMLELVGQHRALVERLDALLVRLEESGGERGIPAPLLAELGVLFADLGRHDAEENALVLWTSRSPAGFARDVEGP